MHTQSKVENKVAEIHVQITGKHIFFSGHNGSILFLLNRIQLHRLASTTQKDKSGKIFNIQTLHFIAVQSQSGT